MNTIENLRKQIEKQAEIINFYSEIMSGHVVFLHAHGIHDSKENIDKGELLRSELKALQEAEPEEEMYPTFEQCLREEFLINSQNYPEEYHNLFHDKFNRAKRIYDDYWKSNK